VLLEYHSPGVPLDSDGLEATMSVTATGSFYLAHQQSSARSLAVCRYFVGSIPHQQGKVIGVFS
jgi:hypothetical protein